jgi:Na+/melibiose symporter-like transporter
MSLGLILAIILIIFLLGGFSGRFGGYGYGYGHGGVGIIGTILIIVVILMLLGRAARPPLSRRPARPCGVRHRLHDADRQRLSALPAELARARPGDLGV